MSLFADSLVYGADTVATQAGDISFGKKAGAVVAGATLSGLHSIYNTFASGANALGANIEQADTYQSLSDLDQDWASYYKENKSAIDVAGFVAGSLLPGTLAVKALNAARAGMTTGAVGTALNFTRVQQAKALQRGLQELAVEGGTVFTRINRNKIAAMGWEFADQAIQTAAFETAVALTMNQSPLLADDDWWSIGKTVMTGTVLGGAIGGGINSFALNRGLKELSKQTDLLGNKYQALGAGLGKLGLAKGDESFAIIDSVLRLPDSVLAQDAQLAVDLPVIGGRLKDTVDITPALRSKLSASNKAAMEQFQISLRRVAGDDADKATADAFTEFVTGRLEKLKAAGASPEDIRDTLIDTLANLRSVKPATELPPYGASDLFYFRNQISEEQRKTIKSVEDLRDFQVATTPFKLGDNAYEKPYIYLGTKQQLAGEKIARIGHGGPDGAPTLGEAWKQGYNVAILPDGALRINQNSKMWRRVIDPVYDARRYLNTRTGAVTGDTVLTAADRVPKGQSMKITERYVEVPQEGEVARRFDMAAGFKPDQTVGWQTARHAWASQLSDAAMIERHLVIDGRDISLLERLKEMPLEAKERFTITAADGSTINGTAVERFLLNSKIDGIQAEFLKGVQDVREVAYRYNADEAWVENLVASQFGSAVPDPSVLMQGMSRDMREFLKRENVIATYATPSQFVDLMPPSVASKAIRPTWQQQRDAIIQSASANGGQFVTGEIAYAYRVQAAVKANKNASASVLGFDRYSLLVDLDQNAAKLADSLGSGASLLGSANANYGDTLRLASQDIGKHVHQWIQQDTEEIAAAFATVSSKLLNDKAASAEVGIITNILRNETGKFVADPIDPMRLVRREIATAKTPAAATAIEQRLVDAGERIEIKVQSPDAMEFLRVHQQLNGARVDKRGVLVKARGMTSNKDPSVFYAPPVDTNYFQHFAFVRGIEGKAFGTSEVAMIFGRNADELQKRIALVDQDVFEVITKDGSERYFKAKGEYDFDLTINERNIDSALKKNGALTNFFPETRAQNIIEDYLRYHQAQAGRLVRDAVESRYSQQIQELRALGSSFSEGATSKFSGTLRATKSQITNPYEDYIKTMLDVSKRSEYTFFHQANEFVDALGTRAYSLLSDVTGKATKGLLPWEEANKIAEKHGIKGMYTGELDYFTSNAPRDRNLIKEGVAKANTLLANLVLRFDFAQSLMNVVSTPLLLGTELASIRSLVAKDSELTGALNEITRVKVPGQNASIPSTMRLLANAIKNFHGPEKEMLLKRYRDNGDIKDVLQLYHSAISDLALSPNFKVFSDGVSAATEKVATLTANNWSEEFTRFVSADVMRQLTDPLVKRGAMDLPTANAYISTFVNRVQGNYISSQRPVVFQGVIGGAIGLFQTYSFNLLQQLLRHVENKDKRAIATLFGMQAGLFGLNGTPLFDAVNTHIIGNAAVNQGHYDAYSIAPGLLGKEVGDWLLYGTVSAMPGFGGSWPALYTRGDINPRHVTILPVNPVDVPAIDASIRVVSNLMDVGKKLIGGADISETLLQGLEHNGLNRPLAGMAVLMQGHATTSKGGLISASSDFDLITTASRIVGSRPIDEAIALNNLYRLKAYQAADLARMETLGEKVKSKLIGNQQLQESDVLEVMTDYTKIGGRAENFSAALQRWSKDANTSVVESMRRSLQSQQGQRLNEIMGGLPLPDYRNVAVPDTLEPTGTEIVQP